MWYCGFENFYMYRMGLYVLLRRIKEVVKVLMFFFNWDVMLNIGKVYIIIKGK